MLRISDLQATPLEPLVRAVYGCERFGVAHMADADYLGKYPFHAALLIVAPRLRETKNIDESYISIFLEKYEENLTDSTVEKFEDVLIDSYIRDLKNLVRRYYRCLPPKR